MANNNIGGFFVTLGMKVDDSFKKGEEAVSKFIGTGTKAAAALIGISKVAGAVENSNLKLAKAIGISGSELKAWQDSASKAGVNAGALTSSMAALQDKMQKMKYEGVDTKLAEKLGMLGIGYGDFAEMDATQRIRTVFEGADKIEDQSVAAALVGDTLGSAAREYYDWLALSGRKLDDELNASRSLNFTTDETMKSASAFNAEFNGLLNTTKSISLLVGAKIGEALTPILRKLQSILAINKEFIASGIIGIVDVFKKMGAGLSEAFETLKAELPDFKAGFEQSYDFALVDKIKESVSGLGDAFAGLIKSVGKSDDFSTALGNIAGALANFGSNALVTSINMLKDLVNALTSLLTGDWEKTGESLKQFFTDWKDGVKNCFGIDADSMLRSESGGGVLGYLKNAGKSVLALATDPAGVVRDYAIFSGFSDAFNQKYGKDTANFNRLNGNFTFSREVEKLDFSELNAKLQKKILKQAESGYNIQELYGWAVQNFPEIAPKKVQDGIIAPGGKVTQVAPDDWVLATRNLGDLASVFLPPGITNNTASAQSNYTINQNFSFSGTGREMAAAVQREAYTGTQSAISAAMRESNQRLQLMNGLK